MLIDIADKGIKGSSCQEIKDQYSLEEKFKSELEDLVQLKRIEKSGDNFRNTYKGYQHARIIEFLRDYLNLSRNR